MRFLRVFSWQRFLVAVELKDKVLYVYMLHLLEVKLNESSHVHAVTVVQTMT